MILLTSTLRTIAEWPVGFLVYRVHPTDSLETEFGCEDLTALVKQAYANQLSDKMADRVVAELKLSSNLPNAGMRWTTPSHGSLVIYE